MPAANIKSDWVDGNLVFTDGSGNPILRIKADRTVEVPSGAGLVTSSGIGTPVAGKCVAAEHGDGLVHKTVLTLSLTGDNDLDLAGDADNGAGVKIYDFPAGRILLLGATIDAVAVCNDAFEANPNDVFKLGVGSVSATQAAEGDLTLTEQDIIPATTIDTQGNTVLENAWKAALAASAQFDGTTSALDLFINAAVLNASTSKAVTIAITGILTLHWINLGDY